ncbi:hypothetical protein QD46_25230 [Paenibacillus polymyxa]|uniref:DUF4365 domain-containing protein n=2 Tax=Paenibacillus polymyxa TaxID=1406 RepID=UPI0005CEC341|nr:DUF4365 domain-containing protein [Paenibacillus polymyxa]KJD37373.1 hypothetical protein QD46_25230 [Paenibacillus polymyxa]
MTLSNGQIERLAVGAITNVANQPGCFLVPNIPVGDKGISFDGNISVFTDSSEKKESLFGIVPVQVKGTEVAHFHKGVRSFSLDMGHYRNYLNSDGVLLLVVEVKSDGDSKIFYKSLLGMELNQLVRIYGHQKTKSVELRPLEETNLYTVCYKFLREQKHQPRMLVEKQIFSPEAFQEYRLSSTTFDTSNPKTSSIFEHDFNVYGVINETHFPYKVARIESMATSSLTRLSINGNLYNLTAELSFEQNKTTVVIEQVVTINIYETEQKFNFHFMGFRSLSIQLELIPLVIDLLSGHPVDFEDYGFVLKLDVQKISDDLREMQIYHQNLLDMVVAYKLLGIPENTLFESSDNTDVYLQLLAITKTVNQNFLHGIVIEKPENTLLLNIKLGDKSIVVLYNPKGERLLINGYSEAVLKIECVIHTGQEEEGFPHSIYSLLSEEALGKSVNFDFDIIKRSFDSFDPFINIKTFDWTNQFCLKCVHAYDLSNNSQLLDLANYVYDKYPIDFNTVDYSDHYDRIIFINRLQIHKRLNGTLDEVMSEKLIEIKHEAIAHSDKELLFCINVLLEIKIEASIGFRQLKYETQEFYKDLPIYKLYLEL